MEKTLARMSGLERARTRTRLSVSADWCCSFDRPARSTHRRKWLRVYPSNPLSIYPAPHSSANEDQSPPRTAPRLRQAMASPLPQIPAPRPPQQHAQHLHERVHRPRHRQPITRKSLYQTLPALPRYTNCNHSVRLLLRRLPPRSPPSKRNPSRNNSHKS
jgi:hypothetical protein